MIDNLLEQGIRYALEKKYNKEIYEAKFGRKPFVDGLSRETHYRDRANRTIKKLDKVL